MMRKRREKINKVKLKNKSVWLYWYKWKYILIIYSNFCIIPPLLVIDDMLLKSFYAIKQLFLH